jgi:hypothetical protein
MGRDVSAQATEVSIRVDLLNRMTALARPHSVFIAEFSFKFDLCNNAALIRQNLDQRTERC